jgi:Lrp/AsnC family transcriptional regulator
MVVDIRALGFSDYGIFVEGERPSRALPDGLLAFLKRSPLVPWVVEYAAGRFKYAFSLVARHVGEIDDFLLELGERGQARQRQAVISRVCWHVFGERYLVNGRVEMGAYQCGAEHPCAALDALDWKLLRLLSAPRTATLSQLARSLSIPVSTVDYRLKALERSGVIICHANMIDAAALGMQRYHVLLTERRRSRTFRRALMSFLEAHHEAVGMTTCVGEWDYEFEVHASDPEAIGAFEAELNTLFRKHPFTVELLQVAKVHKLQPLPAACMQT